MSEEFKEKLNNWSDKYDSILNDDDPVLSDFETKEDELIFIQEGNELAKCLQKELGDTYQISYYSDY